MHRSLLIAVPLLLAGATITEGVQGTAQVRPDTTAPAAIVRPETVSTTQPLRVLDTRFGTGGKTGQLVFGERLPINIPQAAAAGATAVALNLTATEAVAPGWLKAWPCNQPQPATSSLNYVPGRTSANAVLVGLSSGVCLASNVPVHVVVDVSGWITGSTDLTPSAPNRLLDTRESGDPLRPGIERRLKVAGTPGISASASIAALNLTVDGPALAGWVVAYPCGQPTNASTVNFGAGETVANLTLVGLTSGDVCIKSLVDVQLIVDAFGWSSGGGMLKVQAPRRLLDTREPSNWQYGIAQSGDTLQLRVAGREGVPNDADAAFITVTVADPSSEGFVTVWPCDQPFPTASTINTFPSALRSNLALVKLSVADGEACLRYVSANATPTNLIVDAVGWITGSAVRSAPTGTGRISCGLPGAVFCETFDAPAGNGGKTGDLSPILWGVSRVGDINPGSIENAVAQVSMTGCGTTAWVFTPSDVRICNGKMFETVNDGGNVVSLNTYPKQPFDFAGRTGRVAFDVSADSEGSHGAWPEFVITDRPIPGMRSEISGQTPPGATNSVGFTIDGCSTTGSTTGVGRVFMTKNGAYSEASVSRTGCVNKGNANALNHFEVRISQNRLEVWGTDPGSSALRQLAVADNLGLTFTKGLVWLNDVHYNARKSREPCECGPQWNHTFAWDNLAFDGPKTYRDLGFDVPEAMSSAPASSNGDARVDTGWTIGNGPVTLTVNGVFRTQQPTGALVVMNTYAFSSALPSVSINGNAPIAASDPFPGGGYSWRSIAIPVPVAQVSDGTNTITLTSPDGSTTVANVSIILVAGAPVP